MKVNFRNRKLSSYSRTSSSSIRPESELSPVWQRRISERAALSTRRKWTRTCSVRRCQFRRIRLSTSMSQTIRSVSQVLRIKWAPSRWAPSSGDLLKTIWYIFKWCLIRIPSAAILSQLRLCGASDCSSSRTQQNSRPSRSRTQRGPEWTFKRICSVFQPNSDPDGSMRPSHIYDPDLNGGTMKRYISGVLLLNKTTMTFSAYGNAYGAYA